MPTDKKGVEPKTRKPRNANRKFEELTLNEQRSKLLKQLAKFKGIITRNKTRYEAITPHKTSKNKDLEKTKAKYKKNIPRSRNKACRSFNTIKRSR